MAFDYYFGETDLNCIPEIVLGRTLIIDTFVKVCTLGLISFVAKTTVFWSLSQLLLSDLEVIFDLVCFILSWKA